MHPFSENPERLKQYGAFSLRRRGGDGALEAIPVKALLNTVVYVSEQGIPSAEDTSRRETLVALAPSDAVAGCVLS